VSGRVLVAVGLVALLAACGGAEAEAPTLPRPLAASLAERAEAVAEALEAGDLAAARRRADALLAQAIAAVNDGRVPPALAEPLLASVNALAASIPAPAPAQPAVEDEDDEDDEERGQGKGKKRGKGKKD